MGSYATLGAVDVDQAHAFYDAVLAAIGWRSHADFPGWRGNVPPASGK